SLLLVEKRHYLLISGQFPFAFVHQGKVFLVVLQTLLLIKPRVPATSTIPISLSLCHAFPCFSSSLSFSIPECMFLFYHNFLTKTRTHVCIFVYTALYLYYSF